MAGITEIGFTDEQLDMIIEYKKQAEAVSLQVAILNAISVASDRLDFIDDTVVRCKECKWYDPLSSMCDNCGLPREKMYFCADGRRRKFADLDTAQHGDQDVLMPAT